jgi:hypothetical protein
MALQEMPSSHLLQFLIPAPWSHRHFVPLFRHVLESTVVEKELLLQVQDLKSLAHFLSSFLKDVSPALKNVAFGNGAVICRPSNGVLNLLVPSARFQASKTNQG